MPLEVGPVGKTPATLSAPVRLVPHVDVLVRLQPDLLSEALVAHRAAVRLLAGVCEHVPAEVSLLTETLATVSAEILLLSCVNSLVRSESPVVLERLVTQIATERPFLRVNEIVSFEISGEGEALATLSALMWFLLQVNAFVLLQFILPGETSRTLGACKRLFIPVYVLYVCNETVLCFQVTATLIAVVRPFFGVSEPVSHKTRLSVETLFTLRTRVEFLTCVNGQMEFEILGISESPAALFACVWLLSGVIILVSLQY